MAVDRSISSWFKQFAYITFSCLLLLILPQCVYGQVDEGSISGVVQDSSGAAVPNAQLTLLNTDQGITLQATTGGGGEYTISPVRIGHYTLTATAPGFSATTQQNITVAVGQHVQVNVKLALGAATQTIQVT
ncbi:MAG: carboxypeptidase-like regulatory domain-containing protein, partial [Acidobacteriaceae bacterium]